MNHTYTKNIVVFIDILGFKDIISQTESSDSKLHAILNALGYLKKLESPYKWSTELVEIEECAQYKGLQDFNLTGLIKCTCFSDSIVISIPVNTETINPVASTLIANLASFGANLITKKVLLRGGITIGNLIHTSDGIVMGKALIDAYHLEASSAIYPRIIISDKLVDQLNYPILKKRDSYPYHQYLSRFDDGCIGFTQFIFFQVLQSNSIISSDKIKAELEKVADTIIEGLNSSVEKSRVYEKYHWLKKQYEKLTILDQKTKPLIKYPMENTILYFR